MHAAKPVYLDLNDTPTRSSNLNNFLTSKKVLIPLSLFCGGAVTFFTIYKKYPHIFDNSNKNKNQ